MYHSELQFSHLTDYLTPDNTKGFSTNSIFYIKVVNFMNLVQDWTKFVSFKYIIPFILSFSVFGDPLQLFSFDYTGDESGWGVFYFVFIFILCKSSQSWLEYIFIFFIFLLNFRNSLHKSVNLLNFQNGFLCKIKQFIKVF